MTSQYKFSSIKSKKQRTILNFETSTIKSNYVRQKLNLMNTNRNEFRQFLNFYKNNPTNRLISRAHYNPTLFGITLSKPVPKTIQTTIPIFQIPNQHIPVSNYYELLSKGIIPVGVQAAGTSYPSIISTSDSNLSSQSAVPSTLSTSSYLSAKQNFKIHQTNLCQICDCEKHTQFYSSNDINTDSPISCEEVAENFADMTWFERICHPIVTIKNLTVGILIKLIIGVEPEEISNELKTSQPYNIKMCDECAITIFSMTTSPDQMQDKEKQINEKGLNKIKLQKEKLEAKSSLLKTQLEVDNNQIFKNFSFQNEIRTTELAHKHQETSINEAKIINLDLQNSKLSHEINTLSDKSSSEIGLTDAQADKIQAETKLIQAQTKDQEITYSEKLIKSAVETLKFEREYEKLKEKIELSDIYGYVVSKTTGQQINEQHEKYVAQLVNTYFDNKKFFDYQLIAWTQKIIAAMYIRDTKYALSSYITFTTNKTKQMPNPEDLDKTIPTYNLVKNINKVNETRALKGKKTKFFGLMTKTNEVKHF